MKISMSFLHCLNTGSRVAEQVRGRVGAGRERGVCVSPSVVKKKMSL